MTSFKNSFLIYTVFWRNLRNFAARNNLLCDGVPLCRCFSCKTLITNKIKYIN